MIDTRLTHQRIWEDTIRPQIVDRLDLLLGTRDYWLDKFNHALDSFLLDDLVALVILVVMIVLVGLALLVTILQA